MGGRRRPAAVAAAVLLLVTWPCTSSAEASSAAACVPPPGVAPNLIDPATPAAACTKAACTADYAQCSPRARQTGSGGGGGPPPGQEDLVLVFSDEFDEALGTRDFRGARGDPKWTAFEGYYAANLEEWQNYEADQLAVSGGALRITLANRTSTAVFHGLGGESRVTRNLTSGMLQGWQKACFTGGYVEVSLRLPGNAVDSGLWVAIWLLGNLGRAGYVQSTEGVWPFSYDVCEGSGRLPWTPNAPGQAISACHAPKGRGAPEMDILEYGIFEGVPTLVNTLQMAPVAPPGTSWMATEGGNGSTPRGIHLPGADTPLRTQLGKSVHFGPLSRPGFPRPGTKQSDWLLADSALSPDHFAGFHRYGVLWEPGQYVRWFLDDEFLFEVNAEALKAQANAAGESIGERQIPVEPSYIVLNLAAANNTWARVSDEMLAALPAELAVDHVRVWQRPGAINVGCDPPGFPTREFIACNRAAYLGRSDHRSWRLGPCNSLNGSNQENTLLLAVAAALAAVAVATAVLLAASSSHLRGGAKQQPSPEQEALLALAAAGQGTAAYLAVRAGRGEAVPDAQHLAAALREARPDLLSVARAARTAR